MAAVWLSEGLVSRLVFGMPVVWTQSGHPVGGLQVRLKTAELWTALAGSLMATEPLCAYERCIALHFGKYMKIGFAASMVAAISL